MSRTHRFTAELEAGRGGGAMVLVPRDIAAALGGLKQMRMVGTLNGVPYQSSTMPYGGRGLFMGVRFDALSYTRRKDLAGPISNAKRPETRAARLDHALARLREMG